MVATPAPGRVPVLVPNALFQRRPVRYWSPDQYSPHVWNLRVTALMDYGLTFAEAADFAGTSDLIGDMARHIARYREAGFTYTQAFHWWMHDFTATEATRFANAGWHPHQAGALYRFLSHSDPSRQTPPSPQPSTGGSPPTSPPTGSSSTPPPGTRRGRPSTSNGSARRESTSTAVLPCSLHS